MICNNMVYALNNLGCESLSLLNADTLQILGPYSDLNIHEVKIPTEIREIIKNDDTSSYIAVHNHPNNSNISVGDLVTLLTYINIPIIIVCTNSCKYCYSLTKCYNNIDEAYEVYEIYWKLRYKISKDKRYIHMSALDVIRYLSNYGIVYKEYKNF